MTNGISISVHLTAEEVTTLLRRLASEAAKTGTGLRYTVTTGGCYEVTVPVEEGSLVRTIENEAANRIGPHRQPGKVWHVWDDSLEVIRAVTVYFAWTPPA